MTAPTKEWCPQCDQPYTRTSPFSHRCQPAKLCPICGNPLDEYGDCYHRPTVISRRVSVDERIDGRREGELPSEFDHD